MRSLAAICVILCVPLNSVLARGSTREIPPCTPSGVWLDVAVAIDYSNNMGTTAIFQMLSIFTSRAFDIDWNRNAYIKNKSFISQLSKTKQLRQEIVFVGCCFIFFCNNHFSSTRKNYSDRNRKFHEYLKNGPSDNPSHVCLTGKSRMLPCAQCTLLKSARCLQTKDGEKKPNHIHLISMLIFQLVTLDHYNSTSQFINEIFSLAPSQTTDPDGLMLEGLLGAESILEKGRLNGKRSNVRQTIILFASEYKSSIEQDDVTVATTIKDDGVSIIVVDCSKGQNIKNLNSISSPGMVFLASDPNLIQLVQGALCKVNTFCLDGWTQVSDSYPNGLNMKGECVRSYTANIARTAAGPLCSQGGYLVNVFDQKKDMFVLALARHDQNTTLPQYWLGLSNAGGSKLWDQMTGEPDILVTKGDYSGWYPNYSTSNLSPTEPFAFMSASSASNGWYIATARNFYPSVCQTNTCDTDNYCS